MTDPFWAAHDAAMAAIRRDRPQTLDGLAEILGRPEPGLTGAQLFAPEGGELLAALEDAGWTAGWVGAHYLWDARSETGTWINYCEGDINEGRAIRQ